MHKKYSFQTNALSMRNKVLRQDPVDNPITYFTLVNYDSRKFSKQYDSRDVIYEHKMYIRFATDVSDFILC